MKLLVDMNLSPRWVNLLADAGIEAAHWMKARCSQSIPIARGCVCCPCIEGREAEQGDNFAKEKLDYLISKASPRQVAERRRLLAEWKRAHGLMK